MKEAEFAYQIRQALNEGADRLDYRTAYRLEQARSQALAAQRVGSEATVWVPALQTAGTGGTQASPGGLWAWLWRAGLVAPVIALLIGFVGIYQWQREQTIEQLANIDLAVLLDEAPIDTYADSGFGVMLNNRQRYE